MTRLLASLDLRDWVAAAALACWALLAWLRTRGRLGADRGAGLDHARLWASAEARSPGVPAHLDDPL